MRDTGLACTGVAPAGGDLQLRGATPHLQPHLHQNLKGRVPLQPFAGRRLMITVVCLATLGIALMLNFPGDCAPDIANCGEGRRYFSFVVMVLGAAWLVYLVVRFIRNPRRFR